MVPFLSGTEHQSFIIIGDSGNTQLELVITFLGCQDVCQTFSNPENKISFLLLTIHQEAHTILWNFASPNFNYLSGVELVLNDCSYGLEELRFLIKTYIRMRRNEPSLCQTKNEVKYWSSVVNHPINSFILLRRKKASPNLRDTNIDGWQSSVYLGK